MKKFVDWNEHINGKNRADIFIEIANLDEIDSAIIRGRRDGKYQFEVAAEANVSIDTIKYRTNKLIQKYKQYAKRYPHLFTTIKEYENVSAVVSILTDTEIYSIAFDNEDFDTFADIRNEVIRRIERKYNIEVEKLGKYRTAISGTYVRHKKD